MLAIECYPVLDGLMVRVRAIDHSGSHRQQGIPPSAIYRTIPVHTVEHLGADEAIRDVIVDCFALYPGLLEYALI